MYQYERRKTRHDDEKRTYLQTPPTRLARPPAPNNSSLSSKPAVPPPCPYASTSSSNVRLAPERPMKSKSHERLQKFLADPKTNKSSHSCSFQLAKTLPQTNLHW